MRLCSALVAGTDHMFTMYRPEQPNESLVQTTLLEVGLTSKISVGGSWRVLLGMMVGSSARDAAVLILESGHGGLRSGVAHFVKLIQRNSRCKPSKAAIRLDSHEGDRDFGWLCSYPGSTGEMSNGNTFKAFAYPTYQHDISNCSQWDISFG